MKAGIDPKELKIIIFQSGSIGRTNLLGGHVDVAQSSMGGFIKHHEQGALRILAITSPERLPWVAESIPTWREQGVDVIMFNPKGVFGPPGMPADQIDYWDRVFEQTTASVQFREAAARVLKEIAFLAHEPYVETVMMLEQELREVPEALDALRR